jgi:3-methyladenine DNA glycosylase AlkD
MTPIKHLRRELAAQADEATRLSSLKFFKESITLYGVKTPSVRIIAKTLLKDLRSESKHTIFNLCEELWKSGYQEEAIAACEWSLSRKQYFEPGDFAVFEHWVRSYVNNWATCDTLCNHTIGEFLLKFPAFADNLALWAEDSNRWVRRAAAVSLIVPARRGKFLEQILKIAAIELEDPDDLVQKGYGWLLKSAAGPYEELIFDFVQKHKAKMPRTALRCAIEKMSPAHKQAAMAP